MCVYPGTYTSICQRSQGIEHQGVYAMSARVWVCCVCLRVCACCATSITYAWLQEHFTLPLVSAVCMCMCWEGGVRVGECGCACMFARAVRPPLHRPGFKGGGGLYISTCHSLIVDTGIAHQGVACMRVLRGTRARVWVRVGVCVRACVFARAVRPPLQRPGFKGTLHFHLSALSRH